MVGSRRRIVSFAVAAIFLTLASGLLLAFLYARGGGALPPALSFLTPRGADPLAASAPAEVVLRTLRLAGYEHSAVGETPAGPVARITLATVNSSADIELAWQTSMAALSAAFPGAGTYEVQLFGEGAEPLLAITAAGDAVRKAVGDDDAAALRSASVLRHLVEEGADAGR